MSTEEFVDGRTIFPSPQVKFKSALASFQVPDLRFTDPSTLLFGTWYERICKALEMEGIPRITFHAEIGGDLLKQAVFSVDYKALQKIPDNRLESEIFHNYKDGDPRHPLGKLGKRVNVVGTTADRINALVDSWTGLSEAQKTLFRNSDIGSFRMDVIDVIDAVWCDKYLPVYLKPQLIAMTKSTDFENIASVVDLKNACNGFVADELLLITAEKLQEVCTNYIHLRRHPNYKSRKGINRLSEACDAFNAWFDQELESKPSFAVTFPQSCFLDILNRGLYLKNRPDLSEVSKSMLEGTHKDLTDLIDISSKMKFDLFSQMRGDGYLDSDYDVEIETKRMNSTTGHLNRMKHTLEEESGLRKKHKNKYEDPAYRSKVLPNVRRFMVKRGFTSISQLKGHYRKIAVHATKDEIDKHLSADRLQPK
jgi:hypothetical protein